LPAELLAVLALVWLVPFAAHAQAAPPPTFFKSFNPTPVAPGGNSVLTFTINNSGSVLAATGLDFTDNFPAGLVLTSRTPVVTCTGGTLTAVPGTGVVSYTGGSVAAGATCTIFVEVTAASTGVYVNTSGDLTSSQGNSGTASDTLTVTTPPSFSKGFSPGLILVGGTSTLTLTIDNTASTVAATSLAFTDALPTDLVEVAATPNATTTCTGGTLTATAASGFISYSGGTVGASSSCTVSVDVTSSTSGVISDVTGTHTNTTGALTSSAGNSGTASANLTIANSIPPPTPPGFSKSFSPGAISPGDNSTLLFTVDNTANVSDATSLAFTDNLPAGVVLTTRAPAITCSGGTLTAVAGTSVVSYAGGTAAALSSCAINVEVTSSVPGTHVNTSGSLTSSLGDSGTATDSLAVSGPPGFSKAFSPASMAINAISTLTFVIDNGANGTAAGSLLLTDNLPAGVVVASPANASTTCAGGTLSAAAGDSTISYSGGTVGAGASCSISVDVTAATAGAFANLATLTSNAGDSPDAADTLDVAGPPGFSKTFAPASIATNAVSTLTFAVDNSANGSAIGSLLLADNLPAGVVVASPANASTTCSGGSLTASPGAGVIGYSGGTVGAGATCTVSVDVTATVAGAFANTATLSSDAGDSPDANDTLTAAAAVPFLGPWGLLMLAMLLLLLAARRLARPGDAEPTDRLTAHR
jgi:hypothetical protein